METLAGWRDAKNGGERLLNIVSPVKSKRKVATGGLRADALSEYLEFYVHPFPPSRKHRSSTEFPRPQPSIAQSYPTLGVSGFGPPALLPIIVCSEFGAEPKTYFHTIFHD